MTQNQLTYWRDQETKRANHMQEYNQAVVRRETQRHNLEMEKLEQEKRRIERYAAYTNRYNAKVSNKNVEYNYSVNSASQREQARTNSYNELLRRQEMLIKARQQSVSAMNLAESMRQANMKHSIELSNLAELQRRNLVQEAETQRSNRASEAIRSRQNQIATQTLAETKRHNQASEIIMDMGNRYALVGSLANSLSRVAQSARRNSYGK